jgi:hypothetical protein
MVAPSLSSLDTLSDIGLRGSADMRPTLLRVLTDLYVQKLRHTPEEERHYTELALRLLDAVDVPTRTAVAARLAPHLSPPARVVQYLVNDLPEVGAPLRAYAQLHPTAPLGKREPRQAGVTTAEAAAPVEPALKRSVSTNSPATESPVIEAPVGSSAIDAAVAHELNEFFFAAREDERRLILLNLHIAAPLPPDRVAVSRDPSIRQRLEAAALSNKREDFANHLAVALHIPHEQARRIVRDDLGEPIAVAVKSLGIQRAAVHRILMFVNPTVGHSVERVHALAALFDEMTLPAAEGMVAIWQSLRVSEQAAPKHQPVYWSDETRARARIAAAAAARRPQVAPRPGERRDAS